MTHLLHSDPPHLHLGQQRADQAAQQQSDICRLESGKYSESYRVGVTSLGSGMMSGPSRMRPLKKAEFLVTVVTAIIPPMEWP